ncbi:MAG: hypothetical protein CVV53_03735 [Spirochaetae bacterium HGW-Spirochaetae-9]|nr:MAG: hypothetical protein CVV53_03735 [Spirochaetae bacterium HGW-Spirochaetae-9]
MKLCVPSWQMPGSWLENARALASNPWIEGMELLFFSYDEEARSVFAEERDQIARFSERYSFSLHLPDPLRAEALELVEMTNSFVELYIFHPWKQGPEIAGQEAWADTVETLRASYGAERFALEYTGETAFGKSLALFPYTALCADTGCLIRNGQEPLEWIAARHTAIREIHLHAARGGKDHLSLSPEDAWLPGIAAAAAQSDWRVVLETFSLADTETSYEAFRKALP